MQRAAVREEKTKREEEIKPDVSIGTTSTAVTRKWYFSYLNSNNL